MRDITNSVPTKGSSLSEQIYLLMKGCYFPASSTMGNFWKKTVLCEFIQNSGMPLGFKTVQDATTLSDSEMKYAIDNLKEEGYIEEIDSPASFLFQGTDGCGYQLKMNAKEAEIAAEKRTDEDKKAELAEKTLAGDGSVHGTKKEIFTGVNNGKYPLEEAIAEEEHEGP